MAIEKRWPAVAPQLFTADGTSLGIVTIANTAGFKVKQTIVIQSSSPVDQIRAQIKRVISSTQLIVGPVAEDIQPPIRQQGNQLLSVRTDISNFTVASGAYIYAEEQPKLPIDPKDIIQAVYRQEPGTTIGVEIDDQYGNPIDSLLGADGRRRLCVDAQLDVESIEIGTVDQGKPNTPSNAWPVTDATTHTDLTQLDTDLLAFKSANHTDIAQVDTDLKAIQGPVSPGTAAQKSALVGGQFNAILPKLSSGQQSALQTDARGRIYANSRQPPGTLDVFGTTTSAPRQLQIDIQFFNGILSSLVNLTTVGTGSGTLGSGNALFSTGTGVTSQCLGTSTETVAYASGCEIFAHFTAAFTTPTSSASYQRIGLYNSSNGFYIGYTGTSFVVAVRNNGVDTSIAQANWNMDTLTGAVGSLFTRNGLPEAVDFTKANVWRIRFGWLGSAPIYFEVLAPDGEWITFHKIQQPNTSASPSIANPNLPITIDVNKTLSDTTNLSIATACWGAGITFASNVLEDPQTYEYINIDRRSELRTATSVMLIGAVQAGSVLDTNMWTSASVGSGTNTVNNAVVILSTGTTANSSSTLSSIFRARFIPGTVNAFHAQIRVPDTGITNNVRRWGAYNANNGVFFQLNGTIPGIGVRFAGTDTIITSFNGPYKYVLDTSFHTYEIQYTSENAYFYQDNKLIHTYNSLTTALTANPHLFLSFESTNSGGGTTNAPLYVGCSSIMRYGEANARPRYFHPVYTARIQAQATATTGGTNTLTLNINPTKAGDLLVVAVSVINIAVTSITDNLGQTYSTATTAINGTTTLHIYYVQNTLANVTSITVNIASNSAFTILAAEYSNINTSSALDQVSNFYNANVTSFTSGSTSSTTQSNELLIGVATDIQHNNSTFLAGINWNAVITKASTGPGGNLTSFLEEQYVTTIGSYAATGIDSQSSNILAAIATFKIANNALSNGFTVINSPTTITIGAGTLRKVVINSPGTTGATVTFYDNTTNSGNIIAVLSLTSGANEISYDLDFSNGLTMVVNSPSADFTVVYD